MKAWCGRDDWHGQHGWVDVDADDEPIGEWAICLGTNSDGTPKPGQELQLSS